MENNNKYYVNAVARVTAVQCPRTKRFIPVIDFINADESEPGINTYQADILFETWQDAIFRLVHVAKLLNFPVVQFEDIASDEFEIMFWDDDDEIHVRRTEKLDISSDLDLYESKDFDDIGKYIHPTTKAIH